MEEYDVIFVLGEKYIDHPMCGVAILRRLLEKNDYKVAVVEMPQKPEDVLKFGVPRLFFGVSSGIMDSMVRNYTALNRPREDDELLDYEKKIPDRAVLMYCNWIKQMAKGSKIVIGGTEATLRRFTHYDYWQNSLRKSILMDTRADILVFGSGEKQIIEIADRLDSEEDLVGIRGTCIKAREVPKKQDFIELPSHEEVATSKEKFCDMQNLLSNFTNLAQKTDNFYILQYKFPEYTTEDLDEYYELPFSRNVKNVPYMAGFEFSVVTHRGCVGNCNFCSLRLTMGDKIISRSESSIIRELEYITTLPHFKGIIDDFGGPSANMYGLDFDKDLRVSHMRLVRLLRSAREVRGIKKVFIRSGIRYDLATHEYIEEIARHHISGKLKIAPEHVNKDVLDLMNKRGGDLDKFIRDFNKLNCGELSFYFMTGHPGSSMKEAQELAERIKHLKNAESVQIFTPTPMTVSTCMYYTGMDPKTKKKIYVPYTFVEKKDQKRILEIPTIRNPSTIKPNIQNKPIKVKDRRHPPQGRKVKFTHKR
jgi:radical SAM superfamily enzyme YgiQ (UPF0313 family)